MLTKDNPVLSKGAHSLFWSSKDLYEKSEFYPIFCKEIANVGAGANSLPIQDLLSQWKTVLEELKDRNFVYRGEGNNSVVIALPKTKKILRFKKCREEQNKVPKKYEHQSSWGKVLFIREIFLPLLGNSFVDIPSVMCLQEQTLSLISSSIDSYRPEERKHKIIDIWSGHALLMSDACYVGHNEFDDHTPIYSVEIKPKQGFLRHVISNDAQENRINHASCAYGMKQVIKFKKKLINDISGYCPLDLFSGCQHRMKAAIKTLVDNPQNNLRIFKDGLRVFDQESDFDDLDRIFPQPTGSKVDSKDNGFNWLSDLLIKALKHGGQLHSQQQKSSATPEICRTHAKCQNGILSDECPMCRHDLPPGCVLQRLLSIQKMDTLGIARIYPLYLKVKNTLRDVEIQSIFTNGLNFPTDINFVVNKINEFLIAATAKDCSIIVTFRQTKEQISSFSRDSFLLVDVNGRRFQTSVKVVDLDPKGPDRIDRYYKKDQRMNECSDYYDSQ